MSINKINEKLHKSKKVDLKTRKVSLNKLDELSEEASISAGNYQYAAEQVAEAHKFLMTAWDIVRFEVPRPDDIQDELDVITENLDSLGIDHPSEVQEVQQNINFAKEQFNQVLKDMEWWEINHGLDRYSI
jgi:hypothetical protein